MRVMFGAPGVEIKLKSTTSKDPDWLVSTGKVTLNWPMPASISKFRELVKEPTNPGLLVTKKFDIIIYLQI